ncbi:hypothetical protein CC86DRAFT_107801 [Ophiobolus disseminans]|uniref:Uncharacterized protein n=1 Tax=Ophiobolus disseminans TaxID=1469910 RepID=A0A6A6ZJ34_9PLEO|nr:hypothetical protein CC86DRAFT_107801 [Ophiobolus disseminans]
MLSVARFAQGLLVASYLASRVSADFVRFSVKEILSIEPREWNTDQIWASINLVTNSQNVTQKYVYGDFPRGKRYRTEEAYKDITISGTEPDLTIALAVYNVGDDDPQEIGLKITSLILSIPSRIPGLGGVARVVKFVIDLFQGAYKCEGPVALAVSQRSQQEIRAMAYNFVSCTVQNFTYETNKGCANFLPFSTKEAKYRVEYCVEKRSGSSNAAGGKPLTTSSASGRPIVTSSAGGRSIATSSVGGRSIATSSAAGRSTAISSVGGRPIATSSVGGGAVTTIGVGGRPTTTGGTGGRANTTDGVGERLIATGGVDWGARFDLARCIILGVMVLLLTGIYQY